MFIYMYNIFSFKQSRSTCHQKPCINIVVEASCQHYFLLNSFIHPLVYIYYSLTSKSNCTWHCSVKTFVLKLPKSSSTCFLPIANLPSYSHYFAIQFSFNDFLIFKLQGICLHSKFIFYWYMYMFVSRISHINAIKHTLVLTFLHEIAKLNFIT